jgi:ATP-binding cassette subfamily A (ABC1) protein 3
LLADRIAILSKGTLRAEGSSAELKDKLGGGYRIHLQTGAGHEQILDIQGVSKYITMGQAVYTAPTSNQAAQIIRCLEDEGLTDYQLSGPTIEDVFIHLADEVRTESQTSLYRDTSTPEGSTNEKHPNAQTTTVTHDSGLELHSGHNIGFFRQGWVLFRKRLTILRRNYLPYTAALLIPVIAAGLVTLFLKNFTAVGCQPSENVSAFTIETLYNQDHYDFVLGPSARFSNATLTSLYGPLLGPILQIANITQDEIKNALNMVDTPTQFNDYINQNFANVTPAGFFLGDGSSPPLLAYKGNGDVYNGVFGQNIMNVMLTNISIATQYQPFDIPWAPGAGKSLQLVVYFGLAMAAYPGFFALYPTVERTRNIRGLEYSNGVRSLPLWLAYVTFDFTIVLVSSALSVIIFAAASSVFYNIGYLFIVFALFGLASILLSYVVSLFARTQLSAYAFAAAGQAILFLVYLIGYLCTLTYAPVNKIDDYLLIVHFTISLITPMGSLIRALFVALNIFSTTCDGKQLASYPAGILQYGGPILYLILQIFALFAVLLWYDSGSILAWYRRVRGQQSSSTTQDDLPGTDEDFGEELARVRSSNDGLRVLHLTKSFGRVTAVENLTFGITRGEVFALLGPNGAGKSTTISLIRGDIQPSKNGGNIFVENIEINRHRAQARAHLGVCPQYDAMDQMTVVEHLRFYARIRGVVEIEHNVEAVIKAVGLQAFSSRMAAKLSGGNKRKLSLGIALIGNPTVLLLDEPSSGMDAAAKRVMWKTLAAVVPGRSLLLTTHSMEEADALANRAGIMAKRMLAMGTSDHLRRKHGDAYYCHLVLRSSPHTSDEEIANLRSWVLEHFPAADIEDKTYHGQLRFSVPAQRDEAMSEAKIEIAEHVDEIKGGMPSRRSDSGIGSLIAMLEDHREELKLEHYSVSPTTLDQVFLTIVGKHDVQEEGYAGAKPKRRLMTFWKRS